MASYNFDPLKGVIIPDTSVTQAEVEAEYKEAFGDDLITTPDTPQGALITGETIARNTVLRILATILNQINPNEAGGIFQDAIGALTNSKRSEEKFTIVPNVDLTGVPGTIIPQGSQASLGEGGEIFASESAVTLDDSGDGVSNFKALNAGAIAVTPGELNTILPDQALGWETVNNTQAGILGSNTQNDSQFRLYRKKTLATQGSASLLAMYAGVINTPEVRSAWPQENDTASTVVINGVTMGPHSFYFCVDGGTDDDVANALFYKKSGGAAYVNGAPDADPITVEIPFNPVGLTNTVIYTVKFDRPAKIDVVVQITVKNTDSVSDIEGSVKQAILDYVNGDLNQEPGLEVGQSVSPFEIGGAVNIEYPAIYVKSVLISKVDPLNLQPVEIPINVYEQAIISDNDISVVVVE